MSSASSRCCAIAACFAGVEHFHLFDFAGPGGKVNENVLAYSNRRGSERALVLYHNKRASCPGLGAHREHQLSNGARERPGNASWLRRWICRARDLSFSGIM